VDTQTLVKLLQQNPSTTAEMLAARVLTQDSRFLNQLHSVCAANRWAGLAP
jgi:hypothetical protein